MNQEGSEVNQEGSEVNQEGSEVNQEGGEVNQEGGGNYGNYKEMFELKTDIDTFKQQRDRFQSPGDQHIKNIMFVRHGISESNELSKPMEPVMGWTHPFLTDFGRLQAYAFGHDTLYKLWLSDPKKIKFYCSVLPRACETAQLISQGLMDALGQDIEDTIEGNIQLINGISEIPVGKLGYSMKGTQRDITVEELYYMRKFLNTVNKGLSLDEEYVENSPYGLLAPQHDNLVNSYNLMGQQQRHFITTDKTYRQFTENMYKIFGKENENTDTCLHVVVVHGKFMMEKMAVGPVLALHDPLDQAEQLLSGSPPLKSPRDKIREFFGDIQTDKKGATYGHQRSFDPEQMEKMIKFAEKEWPRPLLPADDIYGQWVNELTHKQGLLESPAQGGGAEDQPDLKDEALKYAQHFNGLVNQYLVKGLDDTIREAHRDIILSVLKNSENGAIIRQIVKNLFMATQFMNKEGKELTDLFKPTKTERAKKKLSKFGLVDAPENENEMVKKEFLENFELIEELFKLSYIAEMDDNHEAHALQKIGHLAGVENIRNNMILAKREEPPPSYKEFLENKMTDDYNMEFVTNERKNEQYHEMWDKLTKEDKLLNKYTDSTTDVMIFPHDPVLEIKNKIERGEKIQAFRLKPPNLCATKLKISNTQFIGDFNVRCGWAIKAQGFTPQHGGLEHTITRAIISHVRNSSPSLFEDGDLWKMFLLGHCVDATYYTPSLEALKYNVEENTRKDLTDKPDSITDIVKSIGEKSMGVYKHNTRDIINAIQDLEGVVAGPEPVVAAVSAASAEPVAAEPEPVGVAGPEQVGVAGPVAPVAAPVAAEPVAGRGVIQIPLEVVPPAATMSNRARRSMRRLRNWVGKRISRRGGGKKRRRNKTKRNLRKTYRKKRTKRRKTYRKRTKKQRR